MRIPVLQSCSLSLLQGHNARFVAGAESYFLQANTFADLTFAEFTAEYAGLGTFSLNNLGRRPEKATVGLLPVDLEPPREVERTTGQCITPVTNQLCNSCAAQAIILSLLTPHGKIRISWDIYASFRLLGEAVSKPPPGVRKLKCYS